MKSRLYSIKNLNIDSLLAELEQFFQMKGHQVQILPINGASILQAQKETTFSAITGQSSALTIKISPEASGTMVEIGSSKWIDKAAMGMVGFLIMPVLVVIPLIGAYNQLKLGDDAWRIIDSFVARAQAGMPHQAAPPPPRSQPQSQNTPNSASSTSIHCTNCGSWLSAKASFCSDCGTAVTPKSATPQCKKCGTVNHAGARFCSSCGGRFE